MKTCSRSGCGKTLRDRNTTGMCSSGCLSPEAPASLRAPSVAGSELDAAPKRRSASDTIKRFRTVAFALGKDPDAILEEAAQAWLDVVAKAVE